MAEHKKDERQCSCKLIAAEFLAMSTPLLAVVGLLGFYSPAGWRGAGAPRPRCHVAATAPSFEDAIASAPALCDQMQKGNGQLSDADTKALSNLLATSNGARGFFVNWLTVDEYELADRQGARALINALAKAQDAPMVSELMVMNVAMSAATAVAHRRNGDAESEARSQRTSKRAALIVRTLMPEKQPWLPPEYDGLFAATQAALAGADAQGDRSEDEERWAKFLQRWGYDEEQLRAILDALSTCGP